MWIFSKHGFYSVVQSKKDKTIMIRSRSLQHLENLKKQMHLSAEILTSEQSDYKYRVVVPHSVWVGIATELANEIDYPNFKNECEKRKKLVGPKYLRALHDIWALMWNSYARLS